MAASGVALVIMEHTCIDQKSGGTKRMLRADENRFIPELGRLAATIKEGGALAGCQINHLGRYAQAESPLAPSDFASPLCQHSHAMTEEDIQRVITQYAAAALRVKKLASIWWNCTVDAVTCLCSSSLHFTTDGPTNTAVAWKTACAFPLLL
jgi:2,4-dienoyl-CoA reductase-like NADH-dependent reductase (Old Yellow Enzyme family)